jgi:hypothetical protein
MVINLIKMKELIKRASFETLISDDLFLENLLGNNEIHYHTALFNRLRLESDNFRSLWAINGGYADIVFIENNNINSIIEIKHYSPHQPNSEQVVVGNIHDEVLKRL